MIRSRRLTAVALALCILSSMVRPVDVSAVTQHSAIERAIRRSYDRAEPITIATTMGGRQTGVVRRVDGRNFEICEPAAARAARCKTVEFQQVTSTSNGRRVWIAAASVAAAVAIVWFFSSRCFYRC